MSLKKKVVWLPYDFDTAIGINNEGALVFDYDLEDIDQIVVEGSGESEELADVYNGQDSVLWRNIRAAFSEELMTMYQTLRSQSTVTSGLSYEAVEKMFEEHQNKWPEAVFNEDAWFKYIDPLINPSPGKEPTASYLSMLQGSKAEQRKWWLYNRFKYIDSKYNAGTALTDYIQMRGYAKSNITIIPYATIYPTVKFGSYLVSERGKRGTATTLVCPLDNLNDTEIYIYSASQLASVGDLSGFKVGFADFSMATKLQSIKLGDSSPSYNNSNLKDLYLGNNVLLQTIDIRNCTILGSGDQKTVDISGCTNIENVYFDGTQITGVILPNGGILKVLHLPNTITNLTIMNQANITDLVVNVANVSTLRIENCPTVNTKSMITTIPTNARVRLVGFTWEAADSTEIETLLDTLDTMRGLDINGNNLEHAYVEGTIHTTSLTGAQIASFNARYPYLRVTADYVTSYLTFKNYDGETTIKTVTCYNGVPQESAPSVPSRPDSSDGHYSYTGLGWNTTYDQQTADPTATQDVLADRTVYPAYQWNVKTYTVYWENSNGTTLETDTNVAWGITPTYNGSTPVDPSGNASPFVTWTPAVGAITGNTTYTATYKPVYTITFVRASADGGGTLQTKQVVEGQMPTYTGSTPTTTQGSATDYPFEGWTPTIVAATANATYTAKFGSPVEVVEITDSWDTIIANIDNGTYKDVYKVGNYKPIEVSDTVTWNAQIIAIDKDELKEGGNAPLTFMLMSDSGWSSAMTDSNYPGTNWEDSSIRNYYIPNILLPKFPENISKRLQRVKKTYFDQVTSSTLYTYDKVWIPSAREICSDKEDFTKEDDGVIYNIFNSNSSRITRTSTSTQSSQYYWLRTKTVSGDKFVSIYSMNGLETNNSATSSSMIRLGFCLGLEQETITDSWETILANQNYATDYSIGDTKMIDLGTEGKHLMEIVAFDEDDRADGNGKAGITWISKTLLNSTHAMNSNQKTVDGETAYTAGGWENSDMRAYLKNTVKPLIPETVRNAIVPVTKVQSTYTGGAKVIDGQTTTDDVWIPGNREIFKDTSYESTGAVYSSKFNSATNRIKKRNASAYYWWLRSAFHASYFRGVSNNGRSSSDGAGHPSGVALGFCTN